MKPSARCCVRPTCSRSVPTEIAFALGWCYKRLARLDLAIHSLEQALVDDPECALLHYNLACYSSLASQ